MTTAPAAPRFRPDAKPAAHNGSVTGATAGSVQRKQELCQNRAELSSQAAFYDALRITLKWEGGYSNDPDDPGGATMRGIIQRVYNGYRQSHGLPCQPVGAISQREMQEIYSANYWNAAGCGSLSRRIATVHFDTAVNCGTGGASSVMKRACAISGFSKDQLSSLTPEQETRFLVAHTQARMERYERICAGWEARGKNNPYKFLNGWSNRTCDVAKFVGVPEAALSKIFSSACLARSNGTARDWVIPSGWSQGFGDLKVFLGGAASRLGGKIVGFFGSLTSLPSVDADFGEPEPTYEFTPKGFEEDEIAPGTTVADSSSKKSRARKQDALVAAAEAGRAFPSQHDLDRRREDGTAKLLEEYFDELLRSKGKKKHSSGSANSS